MKLRRILSIIIDITIILLFEALFYTFIGEAFFDNVYVAVTVAYLIALTLLAFLQSKWRGYTIGKFLMKLQVVSDENNSKLPFFKYWVRLMLAYFLTFISLGILFVVSLAMILIRKDRKTIYDLIVNTKVIKHNESQII